MSADKVARLFDQLAVHPVLHEMNLRFENGMTSLDFPGALNLPRHCRFNTGQLVWEKILKN